MQQKINDKIAWLLTTMGYGESLLYWEPILSKVMQMAPNMLIYLTPGKIIAEDSNLNTSSSIKIFRITIPAKQDSAYNRIISIISPIIIKHVWKFRPKIIVLSEFGLLTIYGILYKVITRRCKIMLLVESNPGNMRKHKIITRKMVCKYADIIMTNNISGKKYLQDILNIDQNKIICKPYLVSEPSNKISTNDNINNEVKDFIGINKTKLLYVGQLTKRKGVDNLIRAIARLNAELLEQTSLAIVGGGSEDDLNRLQTLTRELNIENSVNFIGRVSYNTIDILYKKSDIFVLPTLNDYRALVGFEAISYGLPVLLSIHDGSSREIVDEGENGFTFDPEDIVEFANKLELMLGSSEKRHSFSTRSKEIASKFTSEVAANNIIETIKVCLN